MSWPASATTSGCCVRRECPDPKVGAEGSTDHVLDAAPPDLTEEEQIGLKQVLASCRHLKAAAAHVAAFTEMLPEPRGENLNFWMAVGQVSYCALLLRDRRHFPCSYRRPRGLGSGT